MLANLGLAFLAGVLSILSPCVLPIVPLVLGAAAAENRYAPAALAAGLALSFVAIGLFVATLGVLVVRGVGLGGVWGEALMRWRGRLLNTGKTMNIALGVLLMLAGVAILSGVDKSFETWLVDASPAWLTDLTTRF